MRKTAFVVLLGAGLLAAAGVLSDAGQEQSTPLGLPPVPIPEDNPQTPEKIALGEKLYNETRFSTTGEVGCFTCHDQEKAFTDRPLKTSEGINKLTGTRNSPTVINSAYFTTQFWDGRSPDLEDQALHPFINPVEHGLKNHNPILKIVRKDPEYAKAFKDVFGKKGKEITMREVTLAIASFERTIISGDSPFDTQALFTDNRFHNIGVGINNIQDDVPQLAAKFLEAELTLSEVDVEVLTDPRTSEIGRFAISHGFDDLGSFKTPTLRNIAVTAPYMHDGSIETLKDVMIHYNNGGVTDVGDPVNDFLSGGIRALDLDEDQIDDLVAFMEALTSPEFEMSADAADGEK